MNPSISATSPNPIESMCDFNYLNDAMGYKGYLIKDIMEIFLKQIPEELNSMNQAIESCDYPTIKNFAHTMKSSVAVMDIKSLVEILNQMECLAKIGTDIQELSELNIQLNQICTIAMAEVEIEKLKYA